MKYYICMICCILIYPLGIQAQSLNDYLKYSAENNPGLKASFTEFEAALERVSQVNALPDPTFSFGYFISPLETRVGPQRAKFSLTQMFPWFGTLKAQGDAMTLMAEARYQSFLDSRNKLYYEVSAAYFPLYEQKLLKQIEKKNVEILETYKTIATIKFGNGSSMVDVLKVDIMLKEATINLIILNKKRKPLLTTFNNLLNRNENESVLVNDSLVISSIEEIFDKDSLLTNNPILNELDLKYRASEANERTAIKQGLPKIGVGLDYVIIGERNDVILADNGKNALMPHVTVSIPLFRSKYKASVKESQLMQESYQLQKEGSSNMLITNYELAAFEIEKQSQLVSLYDQQIAVTQQALNLLYSAYANSGKEFEEVLQMQQQLLEYEKIKATAITQYHTALAKLNYITAKKY